MTVTVGLEVHTQLLTKSKAFCGCSTEFGREPNSNTCQVCLGMPGALPKVNKKLIDNAIVLGLSFGCKIDNKVQFARKNYFYPDLAKGYQISQSNKPICSEGFLALDSGRKIGIERIHMEEDTAKSMHDSSYVPSGRSYLDYNRAGVPLLEIVSKPDMHSGEEAYEYLHKLKQILIYLGISDGNMAQGSLRCDVNISISDTDELGTKVEIKNLNSFKNVQKAIEIETEIQKEALKNGERILQATKTLNPATMNLSIMRIKEGSSDYRYFNEPDIPLISIPDEHIESLKKQLVELPDAKRKRFVEQYSITMQDAVVLTETEHIATYYEKACLSGDAKTVSNLIQAELLAFLNKEELEIQDCLVTAEMMGELADLVASGELSSKMAKKVFGELTENPRSPKKIVCDLGLVQISDEKAIRQMIEQIFASNPEQLQQYRSGKDKLFGFFVGQLMKVSKGQVNPKIANSLLAKMLKN